MNVFSLFQYCLPQHLLSRVAGKIMNCQHPWIANKLKYWFVNRFQIDLTEAESSDLNHYASLNALFTRRLLPSARPLPNNQNPLLSPADGTLAQLGQLTNGLAIQAKGQHFNALELLGNQWPEVNTFEQGKFATIYLSPKDYHRVHMPCDGRLVAMTYIPGKLFSVNQKTAEGVPNLFARNERVVCLFDTPKGNVAVVLVGAMLVASIVMQHHGVVTPNKRREIQTWSYDNPIPFKAGDELGHFCFGSTVIILLPNDSPMHFDGSLSSGQMIQVNQLLGI